MPIHSLIKFIGFRISILACVMISLGILCYSPIQANESITNTPSSFLGIWKGNGTQINPGLSWDVQLGLIGGSVGSIIGTSAYPSLQCGGELRLVRIENTSITISEDITYGAMGLGGDCIDNRIVTIQVDSGVMTVNWRSNEYPTTGNALLTRISDNGNSMPESFMGTWRGSGSQPGDQWTILFGLGNGSVNTIIGTTAYPSLRCGGELILKSVSPTTITLLEDITYGDTCLDQGSITLTIQANGQLDFKYQSSSTPDIGTGTLTKIPQYQLFLPMMRKN